MRKVLLLLLGLCGSAILTVILVRNTAPVLFPASQPLVWPKGVDQTPLSVLAVLSYEGLYPEDASQDPVSGIAGVVLQNNGSTTLSTGAVRLLQGDRILVFSFTMVPPGAKILVVEKSRLPYSDEPITGLWGWAMEVPQSQTLAVEEYGRSGLSITNLTAETLKKATIYYKRFDPMLELYIGGYTYRLTVFDLRPGIPRTVPVFRYTSGSCRVIN